MSVHKCPSCRENIIIISSLIDPPVFKWHCQNCNLSWPCFGEELCLIPSKPVQEADAIIAELEAKGLNWSIRHGNSDIATSVWKSGTVICGDYYSNELEPLAVMLRGAIADMEKKK